MTTELPIISKHAKEIAAQAQHLAHMIEQNAITITTEPCTQSNGFVFFLTIFILACFVGYYVIWKVTPALHTPLMSVTNAISGVIIIGSMLSAGSTMWDISSSLGLIAVFLASINIFGGFMVTTRMLEMFRKR
jgi:H+-translocating NAD(P) transhydrogenase subunit alpha